LAVSVASEFDHAEQVVADVALLQEMAEGRLDDERVKQAAQVLLEHKRDELPSVSVAVAARLLGVSRTIIESWVDAGVLASVPVRRRRYQITIESIVRVQALLEELRRLGAAASFPERRQAARRTGWTPSCSASRQSWGRSATMTIRLWSAASGRPSSP
jgi:hypothetical protein